MPAPGIELPNIVQRIFVDTGASHRRLNLLTGAQKQQGESADKSSAKTDRFSTRLSEASRAAAAARASVTAAARGVDQLGDESRTAARRVDALTRSLREQARAALAARMATRAGIGGGGVPGPPRGGGGGGGGDESPVRAVAQMGGGLTSLITGLVKIPAVIAGIPLAAQALTQLSVAATGVVSSFAPVMGTLATLPGLIGPVGAAAGVGVLAFSGFGEAVKAAMEDASASTEATREKLEEAMAAMGPGAARAAQRVVELRDEMIGLRQIAQAGVFSGVNDALSRLGPLLEALRPTITEMSRALGDFISQGARLLTSGPFSADLRSGGEAATENFRRFGRTILDLVDGMRHVVMAAQPLTDWFFRLAEGAAANFREWARFSRLTGGMADGFEKVRESTALWGNVLKNLGSIFRGLGRATLGFGNDLVSSFERSTASLAKLINSASGQNAIKDFVEDSRPALREMALLLKAIVGAFFDMGRGEGLAPILRQLRTELLPVLLGVFDTVTSEFGPALVTMVTEIARVIVALSGTSSPMMGLVQAITALARGLADLFDAVPGLRQVVFWSVIMSKTLFSLVAVGTKLVATFGLLKGAVLGVQAAGAAGRAGGLAGLVGTLSALTGVSVGMLGAAAGVGAFALALFKLVDSAIKAPEVDKMTAALGRLRDAAPDAADWMDFGGIGALDLAKGTRAGSEWDPTNSLVHRQATKDFKALNEAVAALAQNEGAPAAQEALDRLAAAVQRAGGDMEDFRRRTEPARKAINDKRLADKAAEESSRRLARAEQELPATLEATTAALKTAVGARERLAAASDSVTAAEERLRGAQEDVRAAQATLADVRTGRERLAAIRDAELEVESATISQARANDTLAESRRQLAELRNPPDILKVRDAELALRDAILSQREAVFSVEEAEEKLAQVKADRQGSVATTQAEFELERARLAAQRSGSSVESAEKNLATARHEGVEYANLVREAELSVREAQIQVAKASESARQAQKDLDAARARSQADDEAAATRALKEAVDSVTRADRELQAETAKKLAIQLEVDEANRRIAGVRGNLAQLFADAAKAGGAHELVRLLVAAGLIAEPNVALVASQIPDTGNVLSPAEDKKIPRNLAASGGVFGGFKTNKPTLLVGEGGPHDEFVIPTDPKYRRRAFALWREAGARLMAEGGLITAAAGAIRSESLVTAMRSTPRAPAGAERRGETPLIGQVVNNTQASEVLLARELAWLMK